MITLTKKSGAATRLQPPPTGREAAAAADWRARLLADLCGGQEGAQLRRLVEASDARSVARHASHRPQPVEDRGAATYGAQCARANGVLRRLRALRAASPEAVARHEQRVRFALDRIDETRDPARGPVRADRMRIALEILDGHVSRAEAFIAALWAGLDAARVA